MEINLSTTESSNKANKLIIIESFNKALRLQALLGKEWLVIAAGGTFNADPICPPLVIRDELTDKHKQRLAIMQKQIDQYPFEKVVLATDPDYTGNIIAQRLVDNLKFPVQPQMAILLGLSETYVEKAINNLLPLIDNNVEQSRVLEHGDTSVTEKILVVGIDLNTPEAQIQEKLGTRWQVFNVDSFSDDAVLSDSLEKLQAIINKKEHDRIIFVAKACHRNYNVCAKLYCQLALPAAINCGWFYDKESMDIIIDAVAFAYHFKHAIDSEEALDKHIKKIQKEANKI